MGTRGAVPHADDVVASDEDVGFAVADRFAFDMGGARDDKQVFAALCITHHSVDLASA
jgi:hypothetical protein